MFLEIPDLLAPAEVARLVQIAQTARFVDGRVTNPHSQVKKNLHHDASDPGFALASKVLTQAIARCEPFQLFAFPRRMAAPSLTKHGPGMTYGPHFDAPFMAVEGVAMRSDLSCTVFLSDPKTYEGGELNLHLGTRQTAFKGPPGSAIVYPSTTLHEVRPVTSGERLVGITFVESRIPDPLKRETLYELNEVAALEGLKMSWQGRTRLSGVSNNLMRMWGEPG